MKGKDRPQCTCDDCENWREYCRIKGISLTWRGFRILTEHDLALIDFPYPPEPEPEESVRA